VVVKGHSWSLTVSPFNTVHTTSYLSLIETMCLPGSGTVIDIESYLFKPANLNVPHLHLVP